VLFGNVSGQVEPTDIEMFVTGLSAGVPFVERVDIDVITLTFTAQLKYTAFDFAYNLSAANTGFLPTAAFAAPYPLLPSTGIAVDPAGDFFLATGGTA